MHGLPDVRVMDRTTQLGARTGDQSAAKEVEAHWEKVTLNTDNSCALIEQVKRRILPLSVMRNQTSCWVLPTVAEGSIRNQQIFVD